MFYLSSEEVAEILRLLDATSHDELTLETDRLQMVFRRGAAGGWTQETQTLRPGRILLFEHTGESGRTAAPAGEVRDQGDADAVEIRSPLPGTFYRAPKPGAAPFVEVGSQVHRHSVVAIVETMKLMNSIHAGAEGQIAEICVANGEFVEPTTVLMRIRAARP